MKKNRQAMIIELLEDRTVCSSKELSDELGCSEMTIRRDLAELEERKMLKRKHNCAFLLKETTPSYFHLQQDEYYYEKKALARAALSLIKPYSTICIDSGTTTLELSRLLPADMPLSVITTNLVTAVELSVKDNIQTYLVGGMLYHRAKSTIIDSVEDLRKLSADYAFMSTRVFKIPGGSYEHTYPLIETKRALSSISKKTVLLFDHTKCEHTSLCNTLSLSQIDILITDNKTPAEIIDKLIALKKEVIVVDPENEKNNRHYNRS